jgi:predicted MPP superfamily phosphohydrolase
MTAAETIRVLLFVTIVVSVFFYALKTLVGVVGGAVKKSWKTHVLFGVAVAGLICVLYGLFVEPYWLSVTHVSIASAKVPRGLRLRIAHISDTHSDPTARLEEHLSEAIAAERPDLIVFTGDSVNSPEGLPVFQSLLQKLSAIAPTFVVKGNWDTSYWNGLDLYARTGAVELNGTGRVLEFRGLKVGLAGLASGNEENLARALAGLPSDIFSVFLYHHPDLIKEVAARNVDLYCAGHTHGGQVALPGYGALVTFSRFGKEYEAGLYREGKTSLYVNRGIGMEGGRVPRVRFWARPELTIIDVVAPGGELTRT